MRRAALLLLLSACKASTGDVADSTTPTPSTLLAPPPDAATRPDERLATLDRWNDAMRAHDVGALTAIYDERIFFYGVPMSRVAATSRLDHLFRVMADYVQSAAEVTIEETDASDASRVSFTKRATVKGKTSTVSAYIVLRRVGADYRIVEESDTTTDAVMTQWSESRYPDECRRAIGAALDELWATRIGPSALQNDAWFECPTKGHQCVGRHWVPPEREDRRFTIPMITLDVDLSTGSLHEQDGWASTGEDLTMAPGVHARIVDACRGAKVYGHGP